MKYLKKLFIIIVAVFTVLLSIKSSYAEDTSATIVEMKALSTTHGEIVLSDDIDVSSKEITTDLRIYQDIVVSSAKKDLEDEKKVLLDLEKSLESGNSYSILSISGVEGSMEFDIMDELEGLQLKNDIIEAGVQGIEQINIIDEYTLELLFIQPVIEDLQFDELEFKFYKNIMIDGFSKTNSDDTIEFILSSKLESGSDYVGTITVVEGSDGSKVDIESGIYDFSTGILEDRVEKEVAITNVSGPDEEEKTLEQQLLESMGEVGLFDSEEEAIKDESLSAESDKQEKEMTLEEELLDSMKNSEILNNLVEGAESLLDEEEELARELLSASEDFEESVETQLESLALGTEETPDTGAETWVLIALTFIINTFYFLSRRKKAQIA